MNDTIAVQQLKTRLSRLEGEIVAIRQALEALPQPETPPTKPSGAILTNKRSLQEQMQQLFQSFSIAGETIGAEALQAQMAQANLKPNELSHSLILARGE